MVFNTRSPPASSLTDVQISLISSIKRYISFYISTKNTAESHHIPAGFNHTFGDGVENFSPAYTGRQSF